MSDIKYEMRPGEAADLKPETQSRLHFMDNLRIAVISLVILHHLAVIYAANVGFYYVEPTKNVVAIVLLVFFQLFNQAWFMGMFFFISGCFTPGSYDRKGPLIFARGRLVRLGAPLAFFFFVLSPVARLGTYQMPSSITGITKPLDWSQYLSLTGVGPLWFIVALAIFEAAYVILRLALKKKRTAPADVEFAPPRVKTIGLFILVLAVVSFLVRIPLPLTKPFLLSPSMAYLPQYASFFALGTVAARRGWLRSIPDRTGTIGLAVALVFSFLLFPVAISNQIGVNGAFIGNGTWQSAVYALWDSILSVGFSLWLITFFRRRFDRSSRLGDAMRKSCFAVYVFHCPIITWLAILMSGLAVTPLLKFCMAGIIAIPLCYAVAYLIRSIPGVRRVL